MLNYIASNTCEGEMVASATIKLCSVNGGQECYMFVATKELIQQIVDGELTVYHFLPKYQMIWNTLQHCTCVTKGVRKYAQQIPL